MRSRHGCRFGVENGVCAGFARRAWSLPELTVGEFGDDVEVSEVAGVLLNQMEQDALERRGLGTVPSRTWFAHLGQIVGLDDVSGAIGLLCEGRPRGGRASPRL